MAGAASLPGSETVSSAPPLAIQSNGKIAAAIIANIAEGSDPLDVSQQLCSAEGGTEL